MKLSDLDYPYPESLVATEPQHPPRVMFVRHGEPMEIPFDQVIDLFKSGDVLVVNDTKVLKRRVFAGDLEVLFLKQISETKWEVLFPARNIEIGGEVNLPENLSMKLLEKGLPQTVELSQSVSEDYFIKYAELPLPPYIQKARHQRNNLQMDELWYQTEWAKNPGSLAAPTASLHFHNKDFEALERKGVIVCPLTLHVGLGTFLPIKTADLDQHEMHSEWVEIPSESLKAIAQAKQNRQRIWALGTTVARSLESEARGMLTLHHDGSRSGFTQLFLRPGQDFQLVDVLMTNFHQPKSTLMALVATHVGLDLVHRAYQWAIERQFRLFSYGDLSIWMK